MKIQIVNKSVCRQEWTVSLIFIDTIDYFWNIIRFGASRSKECFFTEGCNVLVATHVYCCCPIYEIFTFWNLR